MVDNSLNLGITNVASEEFGEPRSSRLRIQSRTLYAFERELPLLRHRATSIFDSYRRLTTEFVTQLELIDSTVGNLFGGPSRQE
jgi:hypothetical protein